MASKPVTERLCEPCEEDNKQIKAGKLCHECQNDPSAAKQTSTSFNEYEVVSDFLESVTLTDDTILHRGAQVAVESTSVITKQEKRTTSKQTDRTLLKCTRCLEFSVKRPEDKENVNVRGVQCVSDNVVVVDNDNKLLKLFDRSGTYLSSTELKDDTRGITCVRDSTFATCGTSNTIYIWTVRRQGVFQRRQTIVREDVSYHVDHWAHAIHYNGTYYCVLHHYDNAITVLDRQGYRRRRLIMKETWGEMFVFGWDIHMDSDTNNIYVPCWHGNGVLCMTIEGKALWFTPRSGPRGMTEIQGTLCVADSRGDCLHLITKEGEYVRKLLDKKDLGGKPKNVCYGQNGKLYISYFSNHIISVLSV